MSSKHNYSSMDEPKLILYKVAVYNLKMCMNEDSSISREIISSAGRFDSHFYFFSEQYLKFVCFSTI